jgi:hypothetical protein
MLHPVIKSWLNRVLYKTRSKIKLMNAKAAYDERLTVRPLTRFENPWRIPVLGPQGVL